MTPTKDVINVLVLLKRQQAREFVLVFPRGNDQLPVALLGTREGENLYVSNNRRWLVRGIPAHFRRYPFIAAETTRNNANDAEKTRHPAD